MLHKRICRGLAPLFLLWAGIGQAAAIGQSIRTIVCSVIWQIWFPLQAIGYALVLLMITYAGVRYVYSSDDPGGRKQAKSMIVNAMIGGILIFIAGSLAALAGGGFGLCPT